MPTTQDNTTSTRDFVREPDVIPLRFSASYASRYNNCHGSANLPEAIPGFEFRDDTERRMAGEGTRLHKIFESVISSGVELTEAANCLEHLASVHYTKRRPLLKDETKYITWWFLQFKTIPPVEYSVIKNLLGPLNDQDKYEWEVPPRRVVFLANALRYLYETLDTLDEGYELLVEKKMHVEWLTTRPKTTADVVISGQTKLLVMDLKMGDIEVSPINNEQLMYYVQTYRKPRHTVFQVHIMQRNNMDYWEIPQEVLDRWVKGVQQSEADILDGDLTLTPGSHCTFCPANPHGRGDRGTKSCPAMLSMLYGERDIQQAEKDILGDDDYE